MAFEDMAWCCVVHLWCPKGQAGRLMSEMDRAMGNFTPDGAAHVAP